jgi:hypothetical protein
MDHLIQISRRLAGETIEEASVQAQVKASRMPPVSGSLERSYDSEIETHFYAIPRLRAW